MCKYNNTKIKFYIVCILSTFYNFNQQYTIPNFLITHTQIIIRFGPIMLSFYKFI